MTGVLTAQPWFESHGQLARDLTWADLQAIPDDSYRYELLDGVLLVSPAPGTGHVAAVYDLLRAARPPGLFVGTRTVEVLEREQGAYVQRALLRGADEVELTAPFAVRLSCPVLDG